MFNYNAIGIGIILRCKKSIICLKLTFYEIPHNFFFLGRGGGGCPDFLKSDFEGLGVQMAPRCPAG